MRTSLPYPLRAGILIAPGLAGLLLSACSKRPPPAETQASIHDLDSLHQVAQHNDSVETNLIFYEEAFHAYRSKFPAVDKPAFMAIAKGKDQAFCLFQPDPARTCLAIGDKYNDVGLKEPARDAYEAGLLSEGANDGSLNVRLWSSLAQLHFEAKEYEPAKSYLDRVLEVEPKNKWAKKLMGEMPRKDRGG